MTESHLRATVSGVHELYVVLEIAAVRPRPRDVHTVKHALAEVRALPDNELLNSDEHDLGLLWLLAAVSAHRYGLEYPTRDIDASINRFTAGSMRYTGRIVPRVKDLLVLLERAVRSAELDLFVDIADHISQGWSGYVMSAFPEALHLLARSTSKAHSVGLVPTVATLTTTSYTLWLDGHRATRRGEPARARGLYNESLWRYRRLRYTADAAWLYTDLVMNALLEDDSSAASALMAQQQRYVDSVVSGSGAAPDGDHALWTRDVSSGGYSTFVESRLIGGDVALSAADQAMLRRFCTVSQLLVSATATGSSDLQAAVDSFSFGWRTFATTDYPAIFALLAQRLGSSCDPVSTANAMWRDLLVLPTVEATSQVLLAHAELLEARLVRARLWDEAATATFDAAVLHASLYGRAGTVVWLERYRERSGERVTHLRRAAEQAILQPPGDGNESMLTSYLSVRSQFPEPPFFLAVPAIVGRRASGRRLVELELRGNTLLVSGLPVATDMPVLVRRILALLIHDWSHAVMAGGEPPFRAANELAGLEESTPAAVTQAMFRLRRSMRDRLAHDTNGVVDDSTVLQGRPGYRLNPACIDKAVLIETLPQEDADGTEER